MPLLVSTALDGSWTPLCRLTVLIFDLSRALGLMKGYRRDMGVRPVLNGALWYSMVFSRWRSHFVS
jgi:hypothetical protein